MDCLSELSSSRLNRPFASEFLALVFPYLFIYSCKRWVNLINDDNILMMENAVVFMSQLFRYPSLCACVCPSLYLFMLVYVYVYFIFVNLSMCIHTRGLSYFRNQAQLQHVDGHRCPEGAEPEESRQQVAIFS